MVPVMAGWRPGLLVRLVVGGTAVACMLWYGLDLLISRHIGRLAEQQAVAHLQEGARFDRVRFERALAAQRIFARLAAGQGGRPRRRQLWRQWPGRCTGVWARPPG